MEKLISKKVLEDHLKREFGKNLRYGYIHIIGLDVIPEDAVFTNIVLKCIDKMELLTSYKYDAAKRALCDAVVNRLSQLVISKEHLENPIFKDFIKVVTIKSSTRNIADIDICKVFDQIKMVTGFAFSENFVPMIKVSDFCKNFADKHKTWDLVNLLTRILIKNEGNCLYRTEDGLVIASDESYLVQVAQKMSAELLYPDNYINADMVRELVSHTNRFAINWKIGYIEASRCGTRMYLKGINCVNKTTIIDMKIRRKDGNNE